MSAPRRRRFIAGAVCPRCGVQDRIHVYDVDEGLARECIDCGFSDVQPDPTRDTLPQGRLDAPRPRPADGAQPIRFYPRPPKSSRGAGESGDG